MVWIDRLQCQLFLKKGAKDKFANYCFMVKSKIVLAHYRTFLRQSILQVSIKLKIRSDLKLDENGVVGH